MLKINRASVAGNLTRDPELRTVGNDRQVASLTVAVDEQWRDKNGEQQEQVAFINVSAWGKTAEIIGQYLSKGSRVFIEGRIKQDNWEDKDGNKRSKLFIMADSVQFLDSKPKDGQAAPAQRQAPAVSYDDSEAPF